MAKNLTFTDDQGQQRTLDLDAPTAAATAQALQTQGLCQYWPDAKAALQILAQVLPSWAWLINLLINAGNAACPAQAPTSS